MKGSFIFAENLLPSEKLILNISSAGDKTQLVVQMTEGADSIFTPRN